MVRSADYGAHLGCTCDEGGCLEADHLEATIGIMNTSFLFDKIFTSVEGLFASEKRTTPDGSSFVLKFAL